MLGVAWPSMSERFGVPLDAVGILLGCTTSAYIVTGFVSERLRNRFGPGPVIGISFVLSGISLAGYGLVPYWPLLIACGAGVGMGAGSIDAGVNNFTATKHGPGKVYWLHTCYGVGATISPMVMTFAITSLGNWQWGYRMVGLLQILIGFLFFATSTYWVEAHSQPSTNGDNQAAKSYNTPQRVSAKETLSLGMARWSALIFFVCAGAEVTTAQWTYTLIKNGRGFSVTAAGFWMGVYWAMFTLGRIVAAFASKKISAVRLLRIALLIAVIASTLFWINPTPFVGLVGLTLLGLSLAPVYPSLVATTILRVGERHTPNTIGFQIAANGVGVAILPALAGYLGRTISLELIGLNMFLSCLAVLVVHEMALFTNRHRQAS